MENIVIYGGSFDPWHSAHYEIVKRLSEKYDKVIVVPTTIRYYKKNKCMFSFDYRYEKVKEALADFKNVEVSEIEREAPNDWRFIDTLRKLTSGKKMESLDEFKYYVAIGSDSFQSFKTWYGWEEILKKANLIVFRRPDYEDNFPQDIPFTYISDINMNISSTQIRKNLETFDFEDFMIDIGFSLDKDGKPFDFDTYEEMEV